MFDSISKPVSNHYGTLPEDDESLDFELFSELLELWDEAVHEDDDLFLLFFDLVLLFFLLPLDFLFLLALLERDLFRPLLQPLSTSLSTASKSRDVQVSSIFSSSSASQMRNWFASWVETMNEWTCMYSRRQMDQKCASSIKFWTPQQIKLSFFIVRAVWVWPYLTLLIRAVQLVFADSFGDRLWTKLHNHLRKCHPFPSS